MCVCVCVTTLAAVSFIATLELNYEQLYHGILFIFNSWILIKMLRYGIVCYSAGAIYRLRHGGDVTIALCNAGGHCNIGVHSCSILLYRGFISPPPLPWWFVSLYIMLVVRPLRLLSIHSLGMQFIIRGSVIRSGLSSLGRQSIPSSLQAYFSLSSLGSLSQLRLTPAVSAAHLEGSIFSLLNSLGRQSITVVN